MASLKTDKEFQRILIEIKQDKNILAFWLDGSRSKGRITKNSDYDGKMIVKNSVVKEYVKKYGSKQNPEIEFCIMTLNDLKKYAKHGSDKSWDRYNFAHLKVMFDRTGKVQKIINGKSSLSKKEKDIIIKNSIGAFINQVYRLEKDVRDGNLLAAKFEAIEGIPFFLEAIFALEGRVRPYNKYLSWELDNYPLKKFPWRKGELIKKLTSIIEDEKLHILHKLFVTIRPIFKSQGYSQEFDEWKGYYKVGE